MSTERWDPFRDMMTLRDAMDRLVQQSFVRPGQLLGSVRPEAVPLDVVDRGGEFEVRAALPGVKPEDVDVTVQGDRLTIRGESKAAEERTGDNWIIREQRQGTWERSITLPGLVSADKAEARLENGMLTLRLPKAQEALPRRIAVGAMGGAGGPTASGALGSSGVTGGGSATTGGVTGAAAGAASSGSVPVSGAPSSQPGAGSQASGGSLEGQVEGGAYGHPGPGSADATAGRDRVTEQSQESFPASDPPSWGGSTAG
jgi:HSP20 family protein